jgi:hypothetical protein
LTILSDTSENEKDQFFYPIGRYRGDFSPQQLAFNANLQEFAQRIGIICSLETGGKLSADEAYEQIKALWKKLKISKLALIDTPSERPELPPEEE